MQIGFHQLHLLTSRQVLLHIDLELLHLLPNQTDLMVKLFQFRTEFWVYDVVVLLGFTDVDTFF